jgi:hypothetical protein
MNPVQRLISDLVDKKLWPVALVLVVSAVAIPLLIGGGGAGAESDAADPSTALAPAGVAATPAVQLVGPPAVRSRPGAVRDPFRRRKAAEPKTGSGAPKSSSAQPSASKSAPGGSSSDAKKPASPAKSKPAAPKSTTEPAIDSFSYQTVVRTTRPGAQRERPLYRLAVVGNAKNPAVQFLGVGDDGEYAIFVLGPHAKAPGDEGACVVADGCRVIGLRAGDKLGVDVSGAGGALRHYEIEVLRVRRLGMSAEQATIWRKRIDPIGRDVLDAMSDDAATAAALGRMRYSTRRGTVGLTNAR